MNLERYQVVVLDLMKTRWVRLRSEVGTIKVCAHTSYTCLYMHNQSCTHISALVHIILNISIFLDLFIYLFMYVFINLCIYLFIGQFPLDL